MAAVLACGEGAVLSHASAAALWGLLRPMSGPVHVSVPTRHGRRQHIGIRLHRCPSLGAPAREHSRGGEAVSLATVRNRIPVTTPARTVADLEGAVEARLVRRARRQAEIAGYSLALGTRTDRTRSDVEGAFLELCRAHGLPAPEVNVRVGRWMVDFLWRERRLAVETDSYRYHRGSVAFEDDHARDLELRARGFDVRRFTELQIGAEPERIAADLRAALAAS
jgi:very-short-patch-repair endonuclease